MGSISFKVGRMIRTLTGLALLAGAAYSQTTTMPAARQHVKKVGDRYFKFTSRLSQVVELNFTMGYGHADGKPIISAGLDRIAQAYGSGGKDAFTVRHFTSGTNGSTGGIPDFGIDDLLGGQVIVGNNIGSFGSTSMGSAKQAALQRAIESEGRGYLGIHGSGDNDKQGWSWYTSQLHPMNYQGHGTRTPGPVYRHLEEKDHIVLQGILESRTTLAQGPASIS